MKLYTRLSLLLAAIMALNSPGRGLAEASFQEPGEEDGLSIVSDEQDVVSPVEFLTNEDASAYSDVGSSDVGCEACICRATQPCRIWYVDLKVQQMFKSNTSYQFGSAPIESVAAYAPMSKLSYSLDSTWTGLRVGLRKPKWDVHFEWLTTMGENINGQIEDFDWNIDNPRTDPSRLDSLSQSSERWNDGQKLELELDYKLSDCFLHLPIEVWPLLGFRWQRLNMTAYDAVQIIPPDGPIDSGDILTLNQQYYIGYVGAQFRTTLRRSSRRPINLTLQADWGGTSGYNVDHHLWYESHQGIHRYTMDSTTGGALHVSLAAETLLIGRFNLGVQADHTEIRTSGTHRWVVSNNTATLDDESWTNGVRADSDQTSITAYLRGNW